MPLSTRCFFDFVSSEKPFKVNYLFLYLIFISFEMLQQILYLLGSLIAIPLLPILLLSAKRLKQSIPQLPVPSSNIIGRVVGSKGQINMLTMGESSIAGVGMMNHEEGISGQIAHHLNELIDKTVTWQVLAKNGFTAEKVNQNLVPLIPNMPFNLIVIGLGGNDTFSLNSPLTFKNNMTKLVQNIKARQPQAKIVIINMPPVADFPAFPKSIPKSIKFFLAHLVFLHGTVIQSIPKNFRNVYYMDETIFLSNWMDKTDNTRAISDFSMMVFTPLRFLILFGGKI